MLESCAAVNLVVGICVCREKASAALDGEASNGGWPVELLIYTHRQYVSLSTYTKKKKEEKTKKKQIL